LKRTPLVSLSGINEKKERKKKRKKERNENIHVLLSWDRISIAHLKTSTSVKNAIHATKK